MTRIPALARMTRRIGQLMAAIGRQRDANVTLIASVTLIPTMFGLGFCIDYARAQMLQSRIAAVADAAALTGTDMLYIQQTADVAKAASTQIFTSQVASYNSFSYNSSTQLIVTVSNQGGLNLGRTVTVTWGGQSANMFSGILGANSLAISGSSVAYATQAPNMNFFLVMDKSPSMLLPTTATGIAAVKASTSDGCAFACHQQFPGSNYVKDVNGKFVFIDQNFYTSGNANAGVYYLIDKNNKLYNSSGTQMGTNVTSSSTTSYTTLSYKDMSSKSQTLPGFYADGYWLTHNYTKVYPAGSAIDLRISDEALAAKELIPYAQGQATLNSVTYKLQFFSYDWTHPSASSPVTQHSTMTNVATLTSASVPALDSNVDWWYQNSQPTSSTNNNDQATETKNMLTSMNTVMPAPGSGLTANSPQEVMLLITDGVTDENTSGRVNREFSATDLAACTTIKNRGIKIAILYTEYSSAVLVGDSWSQSNVAPYLPNVLPALQSCASAANDGSPLVYTVQSDQSISTALQTLFQLTIANSHLIG
ncbi:hypothetical protein [Novosphingobium sp.]|uniref:hypothetical protein n=1 Tax=Novosphingobium sp. TaxID=1874826 RepID=UPI003340D96E